jgi:anti-sigma B factor antagonist
MTDPTDDLALEVSRHDRDNARLVVVAVSGEIDTANNHRLEQLLVSIADDGRRDGVVVDLGKVSFIDSSGLRALLTGQRAVVAARRSFCIGDASEPVRRVLEITGLSDALGLSGP